MFHRILQVDSQRHSTVRTRGDVHMDSQIISQSINQHTFPCVMARFRDLESGCKVKEIRNHLRTCIFGTRDLATSLTGIYWLTTVVKLQ
jgi:hypothetical protein